MMALKKIACVLICLSVLMSQIFIISSEAKDIPYYYTIEDGKVTINQYIGKESDVIIPNYIEGKPVVAIDGDLAWGVGAFSDNKTIKSVTIPDNVVSISPLVFNYCTNLKTIKIGKGLKCIWDDPNHSGPLDWTAFLDCQGLERFEVSNDNNNFSSLEGVLLNKKQTEIIIYPSDKPETSYQIPDSVSNINNNAFSDCKNLQSIRINKNLLSADDLLGLDKLKEIILDPGNQNFSMENGVLFNKAKTELILCPAKLYIETYEIPDSVNKIGDSAFLYSSIEHFIIPNSVITIGSFAFEYSSVEHLIIPDSVTKIGSYAFSSASLKTIKIGKNAAGLWDTPFDICENLESIEIDAGNTKYLSIDGVLFNKKEDTLLWYPENKQQKTYTVPKPVKTIKCFLSHNLERIEVEPGNTAFSSIDGVLFNKKSDKILEYPKSKLLKVYKVPKSVKTIVEYSFDSAGFEKVILPDSIKTIEDFVFWNSKTLRSIIIPKSVINIGMAAFNFYDKATFQIVISAYKNSYAYKYAIKNKMHVKLLDEVTTQTTAKSTEAETSTVTAVTTTTDVTTVSSTANSTTTTSATVNTEKPSPHSHRIATIGAVVLLFLLSSAAGFVIIKKRHNTAGDSVN